MKFDREKYLSYCFETVKRLMEVPSPSGYSREISALLSDIAGEQGLGFEPTKKSCFFLTYEGKSAKKALGLAAHCDTLGAMVRSIDSKGDLNFAPVGGVLCNSLDGEYCFVITREGKRYSGTILSRSPSVHVFSDARSRSRDADNMYVRLDENVKSAEDTRASDGNHAFESSHYGTELYIVTSPENTDCFNKIMKPYADSFSISITDV